MIVGIGVDLVSVSRLAENLENGRFKQKVFTAREIADCEAFKSSQQRYAGKFAAKEALMKAIGKGIRQAVGFWQIEVLNAESGAPYLQLTGEAEKTLAALGADRIHLSISHLEEMAVATVILERS
ncbi:MAG: holo-ACP synthase [Anaerolineales bacterium]|nr:holo-ACP synthase [Anaerolineales bacterium]